MKTLIVPKGKCPFEFIENLVWNYKKPIEILLDDEVVDSICKEALSGALEFEEDLIIVKIQDKQIKILYNEETMIGDIIEFKSRNVFLKKGSSKKFLIKMENNFP